MQSINMSGQIRTGARRPARAAQRRPSTARAALRVPAFPQLRLPWGPPAPKNPVQAERDELLELLLGGGGGGGPASERASDLVDALLASELPFDEKLLGGGPWVVVYTRGAPQL
jgi:hypothetical protein